MSKPQRELRYVVFKISDLDGASKFTHKFLHELEEWVDMNRANSGKKPLDCLVIESDWPEYEPAFQAILDRVEREQSVPESEQ